jgi:biopolymer transport protein ExbD
MSASMNNELRAEPNLTPLLDIVFQLITFFMLVINFSQDNFDARIKLPVAGSARPQDDVAKLDEERLVLNIDKKGFLIWGGQVLSAGEASEKIRFEAQIARQNLKQLKGKIEPGEPLPGRIVIRADRDTPFSPIFTFINICQTNGYQKFDLKAMNAP